MKFQQRTMMVAAGVAVAVLAGLGTVVALESTDSGRSGPMVMAAGGRDGRHMGRAGMPGHPSRRDLVADTLGLAPTEVRAAIAGGSTLAELAEANGSSGQALIDVLVAELAAHLDTEVERGVLTREEADTRLAGATEKITLYVEDTQQAIADGIGRHGGGRHHRPLDDTGSDTGDDTTDDTTTTTAG